MVKTPGGIAAPATDSETGDGGDTGIDRDLFALKVMRDRGLMSEADYQARRAELIGPAQGEAPE